ncbi:MAG: hypothetical protein ACKO8I_09855 [Cyanobacteriota bacterium]
MPASLTAPLAALQSSGAALLPLLKRLRCWVLDQPPPPPLLGQCCDRLRPRFLAVALERKLQQQQLVDGVLVDWRWDSRSGKVQGLLWRGQRLEQFHWLPGASQLARRSVLELGSGGWPLRLVTGHEQAAQG